MRSIGEGSGPVGDSTTHRRTVSGWSTGGPGARVGAAVSAMPTGRPCRRLPGPCSTSRISAALGRCAGSAARHLRKRD